MAILRLALLGHASAVILLLGFFAFHARYRFDFAPFMTLAALVGYGSVTMAVTERTRLLAEAGADRCGRLMFSRHFIQPL